MKMVIWLVLFTLSAALVRCLVDFPHVVCLNPRLRLAFSHCSRVKFSGRTPSSCVAAVEKFSSFLDKSCFCIFSYIFNWTEYSG